MVLFSPGYKFGGAGGEGDENFPNPWFNGDNFEVGHPRCV